jgi:hypothetical protein
LAGVYLIWITVVVILYPLCQWVAAVKHGDETGGSAMFEAATDEK